MAITDYKIKSEDFTNRDITGLPDKPSEAGMSATALKERFDAAVKYIVMPKWNALLEYLENSGAESIGANVEGLIGNTVGGLLAALKDHTDNHKADKMNPHNVNKEQVGLGNVENVLALPKENVKEALNNSNEEVPTSAAVLKRFSELGGGDMLSEIYDPQGVGEDIFKIRSYKSLSELSATASTDLLTIFAAMATPSRLVCDIANGSTAVYPAASGTLCINKTGADTGTASFIYEDGRVATATFTANSSGGG